MCFRHSLNRISRPTRPLPSRKGMNALKPHMKCKDIFKRHRLLAVIRIEQPFHFRRHLLGQGCFPPADLIRQLFVIADGKPIFPCVACSGFQNKLQALDEVPAELRFCAFNDLVNAAEVIDIFDDFKLNIKRSSQSANRDDLFCRFLFIQPLLIRPRKR